MCGIAGAGWAAAGYIGCAAAGGAAAAGAGTGAERLACAPHAGQKLASGGIGERQFEQVADIDSHLYPALSDAATGLSCLAIDRHD